MTQWSTRSARIRAVILAALALTLAVAGCASKTNASPGPVATTGPAFPVTVGSLTLNQRPERIVSLAPSATETLFAVDAGKQVIAVDEYSTYPSDAPKTKLSGFTPNAEAIAAYRPDLVVISNNMSNIVEQLATLHIPTYLAAAVDNLDGVYEQILNIGRLTGHADAATSLVNRMTVDVAQLLKGLPKRSVALTYYYELDPNLFSVTSKTFVGSLFTAAGLVNIADSASASNPYPQLSAEVIIKADPDMIFLADTRCCAQTAASLATRAGWSQLRAVKSGRVVPLDDDIASRWGPRVVDLLRAITTAVAAVPAS